MTRFTRVMMPTFVPSSLNQILSINACHETPAAFYLLLLNETQLQKRPDVDGRIFHQLHVLPRH